jgi:hypothetical protein
LICSLRYLVPGDDHVYSAACRDVSTSGLASRLNPPP